MITLKKSMIGLLLLNSSVALAGTMGDVASCAGGACSKSSWDLGIQALYLKPGLSDATGSVNLNKPITTAPGYQGGNVTKGINNNAWGFGFKLEGSYHVGDDIDFNLNWSHYDHIDHRHLSQGNSNNFFQPLWDNSTFYSNLVNRFQSQWNAVNLEFGRRVHLTEESLVRFHGGLQYADLHEKGSVIATANIIPPIGTETYSSSGFTDKYSGIGPRLGADLLYGFQNGASIYTKAATALVVGTFRYKTHNRGVENFQSNNPGALDFSVFKSSDLRVVPMLEAKAGVSYAHQLSKGIVSVDAGWMWINYFNITNITYNFALQGPYAGVKWVG